MTTPKAIEVNCETGEVIERDLTPDEIAANEAAAAQATADALAAQEVAAAKAAAKASAEGKLAKLGLTTEEVSALLG